jgi:hypothetical protein
MQGIISTISYLVAGFGMLAVACNMSAAEDEDVKAIGNRAIAQMFVIAGFCGMIIALFL